MRKFILIFAVAMLLTTIIQAQDFQMNDGGPTYSPLPCINPNAQSPNYLYACAPFPVTPTNDAVEHIFIATPPILCSYPFFKVIDLDTGQELPNDASSIFWNYVEGAPYFAIVSSEVRSNLISIKYFRAGRFRIHAEWQCIAYTESRDLDITITDENVNANPSAFTLSNVNNCPSPYGGFTINRTNQNNPVKNWYLDVSQCNADGSWMANGQYWKQNNNGTASSGWAEGNMKTHTPTTIPANFFIPGRTYRVKFAVGTGCSGWTESSQVMTINSGLPTLDPKIYSNGTFSVPVSGVVPLFTCKTWGLNPNLVIPSCSNSTISNYKVRVFTNTTNTCTKTATVTAYKTYAKTVGNVALKTDFPVLATQGNYTIEVSATTAQGTVTKNLCVNVSDLNAEFGFCKITTCASVECASRNTSTFANPVVMGAYSMGVCQSADINSGIVDMVETKIEQWNALSSTWSAIPAGNAGVIQSNVSGWTPNGAQKVLLNPKYGSWFNNPTNYASIIANPANNKFRLTFKVRNSQCGWTPADKETIGYFTISTLGPDCRTAGNNEAGNISMIDKAFETQLISFTPNPTTDKGTIFWNGNTDIPASLSVLDISGRVVQDVFTNKTITNGESFEVSLADLPNGIYIYRLNADKVYTGKIIKN